MKIIRTSAKYFNVEPYKFIIVNDNEDNLYIYKNDNSSEIETNEMIGHLILGTTIENSCEVKKLFIEKEYRRMGLAKILLKLIVEWGRKQKLDYLMINPCTTDDNIGNKLNKNELVSFYSKHGFIKQQKGKMKFYYHST